MAELGEKAPAAAAGDKAASSARCGAVFLHRPVPCLAGTRAPCGRCPPDRGRSCPGRDRD